MNKKIKRNEDLQERQILYEYSVCDGTEYFKVLEVGAGYEPRIQVIDITDEGEIVTLGSSYRITTNDCIGCEVL